MGSATLWASWRRHSTRALHTLRAVVVCVGNPVSVKSSALPLSACDSTHLGLYVKSLPRMERFYCDVLGFFVTDRLGEGDQAMVFLSRSLQEHHQLVLAPGRSATSASTLNQISFEIEALPSLIEAHQALKELNISGMQAMNHGGSWSLYVPDPEGNTVELFVKTHWYVPPHATTALDLSQSEELIRQQTQDLAQQTPGSNLGLFGARSFSAKWIFRTNNESQRAGLLT